MPGVIERDPDCILIGTHDGNHMYADYRWYSKERECLYYSNKMEEFIVRNMIKSKVDELKTYDTFDCQEKMIMRHMLNNLDPMYIHTHRDLILNVTHNYHDLFTIMTETEEEHDRAVVELINEYGRS